jgi:hypothetical protein
MLDGDAYGSIRYTPNVIRNFVLVPVQEYLYTCMIPGTRSIVLYHSPNKKGTSTSVCHAALCRQGAVIFSSLIDFFY